MPAAQTASSLAPLSLQGIQVPKAIVNPQAFFSGTRRNLLQMKGAFAFAGLGSTDTIPILQTGIISGLSLKFSGTVTVTLPTGTCASTARWPYDLFKNVRLSANGQSNLINCGGWDLKARDQMALGELNDRGVTRGIGGASPGTQVNQGTLSLNSENWGVGQNVTAIPAAAYPVELNVFVPIAVDQVNLVGAIFAQTSSTDLSLVIDWGSQSDLFTLTGTATVAVTGTLVVEGIVYTVPQANGGIILPDLSSFHSLIKTRYFNIGNGLNEVKLPGQGIGRMLLRVFWRVYNGATPVPLPVNDTNYGQIGIRFGGSDTPELIYGGKHQCELNERLVGSDIGSQQGYSLLDFCSEFALRDAYDESLTNELRILDEIPSGVALTTPFMEIVQETLFAGAAGA